MEILHENSSLNTELCIVSLYEGNAYAIPIRYIERCVLVSGAELSESSIRIEGDEAKVLLLCDRTILQTSKNENVMCVLCRNAEQKLVAICMGNFYYRNSPRLVTLPVQYAPNENCGNDIGDGFYTLKQELPAGNDISVLYQFDTADKSCIKNW